MRSKPAPHVAVLPLGTGNDLSLSFGWGNTFLQSWLRNFSSVYHLLRRVAHSQPRELDCWKLTLRTGAPPPAPRARKIPHSQSDQVGLIQFPQVFDGSRITGAATLPGQAVMASDPCQAGHVYQQTGPHPVAAPARQVTRGCSRTCLTACNLRRTMLR